MNRDADTYEITCLTSTSDGKNLSRGPRATGSTKRRLLQAKDIAPELLSLNNRGDWPKELELDSGGCSSSCIHFLSDLKNSQVYLEARRTDTIPVKSSLFSQFPTSWLNPSSWKDQNLLYQPTPVMWPGFLTKTYPKYAD
jgi:hypothetical protein